MRNILKNFFVMGLLLCLFACDNTISYKKYAPQARGVVDGAPLGKRQFSGLRKHGMQIADSREGTAVIIPADKLFISLTNPVTINPDFQPALNDLVYALKGYPTVKFEIVGHSDNVMSPGLQDNQSSEFALALSNYLTAAGVSPTRISSVRGVGGKQPIIAENNFTARQINRRVEVVMAQPIR